MDGGCFLMAFNFIVAEMLSGLGDFLEQSVSTDGKFSTKSIVSPQVILIFDRYEFGFFRA